VWNKIDATNGAPGVDRDAYGKISRVRLSARTGAGLDLLRRAIAETLLTCSGPEQIEGIVRTAA
jgi:GTP-binding protein HflX